MLLSQILTQLLSQLGAHGWTWVRVDLDVGLVVRCLYVCLSPNGRNRGWGRLGAGPECGLGQGVGRARARGLGQGAGTGPGPGLGQDAGAGPGRGLGQGEGLGQGVWLKRRRRGGKCTRRGQFFI